MILLKLLQKSSSKLTYMGLLSTFPILFSNILGVLDEKSSN